MFENYGILCIVTLEYALVFGEAIAPWLTSVLLHLDHSQMVVSIWSLEPACLVLKNTTAATTISALKKKRIALNICTLLKNWHMNDILFKNRGIIFTFQCTSVCLCVSWEYFEAYGCYMFPLIAKYFVPFIVIANRISPPYIFYLIGQLD